MIHKSILLSAAGLWAFAGAVPATAANTGPTDPEIAHIAYTAGLLDVAAARQALAKSQNSTVRAFAETMVRDHEAVVKKLKVTPAPNAISTSLSAQASATEKKLAALSGAAFDRAYAENEAAYHKAVNAALDGTLIPSADNKELKSLLQTGLTLFREHQTHAEHLAATLKK
jgi:putative membrane protein